MDLSEAPRGRATIRDVSRIAGVSIKTVSRVINNEKYVTAATRARIEQVIASLRFQPSSAARALAGHRSHQIALVCDNPNPWYVYEVQDGARRRCLTDRVRLIAQPYDRGSPTLVDDIAGLIDQVHPDGIILTPPACDDPHVLDELARRRVPFVRIQPGTRADASASVSIDNAAAAQAMTAHLIGLGHRRIGFVTGDRGYAVSDLRLAGYRQALVEAGIAYDAALVEEGLFDAGSGAEAARRLILRLPRPTAIFASNDDMAAGALAAMHRQSISVPGQLSVAGFDDTALAPLVWPGLTTVRQPVRALAEAAAGLLLDPGEVRHIRLPFDVIVRESTGPAPAV